ncbi:FkbM family methyltransferase [Mucilaginibacter mali]|uniref:FkbM family methyltransferase n=1 Tax=Mucilaginibacter mali TaxID=2740462 RepID=A0A7D4Q3P8_9SPHI|nr:FkbM family methyltransferase [Mucilaginibacter mali]QKJ30447.1 FkbM family methyltransferase [Mucilaginibacter mali]
MSLKLKIGQFISGVIDKLIRLNIKLVSFLPNGRFMVLDLKRAGIYPQTIFDVGANVGQTGLYYSNHFPNATVYCFEPVADTYAEMVKNTQKPQIICIHKALGSTKGEAKIYKSTTYSGIASLNGQGNESFSQVETISVDAGLNICNEYKIDIIDLLKIDVEGFEIEALSGFGTMLTDRVKLIYIEVGFDPADACKTHMSDILNYLHPHGFIVSGIYDSYRLGKGKLKLNHADLLLVNTNLIEV